MYNSCLDNNQENKSIRMTNMLLEKPSPILDFPVQHGKAN